MPLLLLLFLALVCLPDLDSYVRPAWIATPATAGLLTLAVVAGLVLVAWIASRWVIRALRTTIRPNRVLNRYDRLRRCQQLALYVGFVIILSVCGWGWAVKELWRWNGSLLPLSDLVLLAPFLVSLLLSWAVWFDADQAAHRALHAELPPEQTPPILRQRGTYVLFHLRAKLGLVFIPLGLLILQKELRNHLGSEGEEAELLLHRLGLAALLLVIPLMPLFVRLVLGLERMPDGPLRQRLEGIARRLHFRCSDLLVWNTRGGVANAMVLGVLPWPRYVVFTDRMLDEFQPEEIEAVFGHEIGHVKHQHMLYYMGFLTVSMLVVGLAVARLVPLLSGWGPGALTGEEAGTEGAGLFNRQLLDALPLVLCLALYIFVVFGYLSRRCERQADIYGCRAVSCDDPDCRGHDPTVLADLQPGRDVPLCPTGIRVFIRALEKVADVNGISRDRPGFLQSWQHSTIALRVEFLQSLLHEPELEPRFQRRVALVKLGLLVLLGTALVFLLGATPWAG